MSETIQVESAVRDRYSVAAQKRVEALCCPVNYDAKYLNVIPSEILERDYGCGDPSRHVRPGETVLDLGSGAGKICFIASQVVGPNGKVIGIDMNDEMLELARRHQQAVGAAIGWQNVEFRKGRIQDLALDLDLLETQLKGQPIQTANAYLAAEALAQQLRREQPLVASGSIDVVISNCVLNLVDSGQKPQLFQEIFRVLRDGGRAVISDIVSDEAVPVEMQNDPVLWSGCISGALTEEEFLQAFSDAGFHGLRLLHYEQSPWRTVQGIEFRSVTVEAHKAAPGDQVDFNQAVLYKGPFREVVDDEQHRFVRGRRSAVSERTYQLLRREPYQAQFEFIDSRVPVALDQARPFQNGPSRVRTPRETKGQDYRQTSETNGNGDGGSRCCC